MVLRGCERARSGVYRARVDGAKRTHAVTLTVALGNLTGGAVETSVIPSSPLPPTKSPRPPRAHGPPRGWCDPGRHRERPMGSFQRWWRAAPRSRTHASVFAVGRRVYVACARDRLAHAALTADAGQCAGPLADGTAVEILAWRPRRSDGTRSRVRSTGNGLEGCSRLTTYGAHRLPSRPPIEPPRVATGSAPLRATESGDSGRRFGQRAD